MTFFVLAPSPSLAVAPAVLLPLSLHDALPISPRPQLSALRSSDFRVGGSHAGHRSHVRSPSARQAQGCPKRSRGTRQDRKSTRLNSSHLVISYAVFCLKKKTYNCKNSNYQHVQ